MKAPTEAGLVRAVLQRLKLAGLFHWRANAGGGMRQDRYVRANPEGTPDVLLVIPPTGRLCGIECKARTGRLRQAQLAWQQNAFRAGVLYWVVRDLSDLEDRLKEAGL